jgi:hypothetical protein
LITSKLHLDTNSLIHLFNNQISSLFINFNKKNNSHSNRITYTNIFTKILTIFTNLRCLKFNPSLSACDNLFLRMIPETAISSTLLELHVNVSDMNDCHHILDGRFDQLRILYINFGSIATHSFNIEQNVGLFLLYFVCLNELIFVFVFRKIYYQIYRFFL